MLSKEQSEKNERSFFNVKEITKSVFAIKPSQYYQLKLLFTKDFLFLIFPQIMKRLDFLRMFNTTILESKNKKSFPALKIVFVLLLVTIKQKICLSDRECLKQCYLST